MSSSSKSNSGSGARNASASASASASSAVVPESALSRTGRPQIVYVYNWGRGGVTLETGHLNPMSFLHTLNAPLCLCFVGWGGTFFCFALLPCSNLVATVNLAADLDLKHIALHARNAEYSPKVCERERE